MSIALIIISLILQFVLPIGVVIIVRRRFKVTWTSIAVGTLAYIGASVVGGLAVGAIAYSDFFNASVVGSASAGMIFTLFRFLLTGALHVLAFWALFRFFARETIGPAGILGVVLGYAVVQMALTYYLSGQFENIVQATMYSISGAAPDATPEQAATLADALAKFWNQPAYNLIIPTLSAYITLLLSAGTALMAWTGYILKQRLWLAAAWLWTAAVFALVDVVWTWVGRYIDPKTGELIGNGSEPWTVSAIFLVLVILQAVLLYAYWKKVYPPTAQPAQAMAAAIAPPEVLIPGRRRVQSGEQAPVSKAAKFAAASDKKGSSRPANLGTGEQANPSAPVAVKSTKATKPASLPKKGK